MMYLSCSQVSVWVYYEMQVCNMTWFPNCIVDTILVDFIRAFPILESVTLLSVDICGCIYDQSVNEHDLSAVDGGTLNQQIFLFSSITPPSYIHRRWLWKVRSCTKIQEIKIKEAPLFLGRASELDLFDEYEVIEIWWSLGDTDTALYLYKSEHTCAYMYVSLASSLV